MAHTATDLPIDELSVEERLTLLGRLWDSLLDTSPLPVPAWHLEVVRQRLADPNPTSSIPLEELRRELSVATYTDAL